MLRLTGGEHKGRALKWLDTPTIRPTPARVREAIFNIFAAEAAGSRWWDLCCGSGVVGLEALSRGADKVVFVDQNRRSLDLLKSNLSTLRSAHRAQVVAHDLLRWLRQQSLIEADFIYCDPPYESSIYQPLLDALGSLPLAPGIARVTLVLEHRRGKPPWQVQGPWVTLDSRSYGDTSLVILERTAPGQLQPEPTVPAHGQSPMTSDGDQNPMIPDDGHSPMTPDDGHSPMTPNDGHSPMTPDDGHSPMTPAGDGAL